jgi:hypothetical protein
LTRRKSRTRTTGRSIWDGVCRLTAFSRPLPSFLIIGGQRCGTGALHHHLKHHPSIDAPRIKEVHYFDIRSQLPLTWYRAHFANAAKRRVIELRQRTPTVSGESSPYYLFHPCVPARVRDVLPQVKLIALLRDPAARALSHYHHEVALGVETLSFADALDAEDDRIAGEAEKLASDPGYISFAHRHYSYAARGEYAAQLARWRELFPWEQLFVATSEEFYASPDDVTARILAFLGLPPMPPHVRFQRPAHRPYDQMSDQIRQKLNSRFNDPNRRLVEMLGFEPAWAARPGDRV